MFIKTFPVSKNILRVVCAVDEVQAPSIIIDEKMSVGSSDIAAVVSAQSISFSANGEKLLSQKDFSLAAKDIMRYTTSGDKLEIVIKKTIDGERAFLENADTVKVGSAYRGEVSFEISSDEMIFGLGQHENGVYSYRGTTEYLYQNNMKIPMPVVVSSRNYAILFDCTCFMIYAESNNIMKMSFDAVQQISYYIIKGESLDDLVKGIRELTGTAVMLPKWAFGYIQSRERYKTQDEIIETVRRFKELEIPLSCIVLDWLSWEDGKWGNKRVDKARFPNLKEMVSTLHANDVAFMISIWPNINRKGEDFAEMADANKLLCNLNTYDAFDEQARDIYWKQTERELFSAGTDAWWCDSTEPFTPDWNGTDKKSDEERYNITKDSAAKFLDERQANAFALVHAMGIYKHQRKAADKRVINLTRSGWPSIQKYGAVLWSGDIKATWDVFKAQLVEGLNMCASGIPYWTLDIGAFFVGSDKAWRKWSNVETGTSPWFWRGDFETGTDDLGYRELYTRWLQAGTFLPLMRSHGTDCAREPWNFGKKGECYYDSIVKYINLRDYILPYTYSLASMVTRNAYTIMRNLCFDFAADKAAVKISDQFMFGSAFMACPVVQPLEYGPNSKPLSQKPERSVYLPKCEGWFDYDTKAFLQGGQTLLAPAPIDIMPLYVKAGAIVPVKQNGETALEIYEGANGSFELYFDNGSDYSYENGNYRVLTLAFCDADKTLQVAKADGNYEIQASINAILHTKNGATLKTSIATSALAQASFN